VSQNPFEAIPSVEKLKLEVGAEPLPPRVLTALVRDVVSECRARVKAGEVVPSLGELKELVLKKARRLKRGQFRHAINATGVILHTNLGRAPVAKAWLDQAATELAGYSVLELDEEKPVRGSRTQTLEPLLRALCGSEAAVVVNNNAAGVFLALHALARNKPAVVSRGELVQIGGGFRVPEILEASGAKLLEVGSTNITSVGDYEKALRENPDAVLLKVHQSNFVMEGHVEAVPVSALSSLARKYDRPLIVDWGSGALWDNVGQEPSVTDLLHDGASVLCFSGDKLLGGPQAGIVVGQERYLVTLKKSPLYRALRLSKFELFLLERCLLQFLDERPNPTIELLHLTGEELKGRAERFRESLQRTGVSTTLQSGESALGGGTSPRHAFPTTLVVWETDAEAMAQRLFEGDPCVLARIENGRLSFDLRTVFPHEESVLLQAVAAAAGR